MGWKFVMKTRLGSMLLRSHLAFGVVALAAPEAGRVKDINLSQRLVPLGWNRKFPREDVS